MQPWSHQIQIQIHQNTKSPKYKYKFTKYKFNKIQIKIQSLPRQWYATLITATVQIPTLRIQMILVSFVGFLDSHLCLGFWWQTFVLLRSSNSLDKIQICSTHHKDLRLKEWDSVVTEVEGDEVEVLEHLVVVADQVDQVAPQVDHLQGGHEIGFLVTCNLWLNWVKSWSLGQ